MIEAKPESSGTATLKLTSDGNLQIEYDGGKGVRWESQTKGKI